MKSLLIILALALPALFSTGSGYVDQPVCEENIQPDCYCILVYDPVCGCNNKTYGNACVAACSGITDYKKGECKDKNVKKVKKPN